MSVAINFMCQIWCITSVIMLSHQKPGYNIPQPTYPSSYSVYNSGGTSSPEAPGEGGVIPMLPPQFPEGVDFPVPSTETGPCPTVPVVKDFDSIRYLGRWFEIERFFAPFQTGDCVTADYGLFPNRSISVVNSNVVDGQLESASAYATLGSDPTVGKITVTFPGSPQSAINDGEPNYGVVATDYENYAVVYSCTDIGEGRKFEYSWILGRRPEFGQAFLTELKKWLDKTGIETEKYVKTNQENCLRRPI